VFTELAGESRNVDPQTVEDWKISAYGKKFK
jgi:hypothetical protein